MIILLNGAAGSGKDKIVQLLLEELNSTERVCYWERYAFADKLKRDEAGYIMKKWGVSVWNDSQKEIYRPHLIEVGEKRRREINGRYLIDPFISKYKKQPDVNYIITDFRFVDEYHTIASELDTTICPIAMRRYFYKGGAKFVNVPVIPEEIERFGEIEKISNKVEIEWIEDKWTNQENWECLLKREVIKKFSEFIWSLRINNSNEEDL